MIAFYFTFALICAYVFIEMTTETMESKDLKSNMLLIVVCLIGLVYFIRKIF